MQGLGKNEEESIGNAVNGSLLSPHKSQERLGQKCPVVSCNPLLFQNQILERVPLSVSLSFVYMTSLKETKDLSSISFYLPLSPRQAELAKVE